MERRGVVQQSVVERDQRQVLVRYLHQARSLVRGGLRLGSDRGNTIADQTHPVGRQCRPVQEAASESDVANIYAREDRMDAWHLLGRRGVHRHDTRVWPRAARIR